MKLNTYLQHFKKSKDFLTESQLSSIVLLSLLTKKDFIEDDEFDNGCRLLLNFGHTFGHAIEASTQFLIPHGISVGFGMLAEIELAKRIGIFHYTPRRVDQLIKHIYFLLIQAPEMMDRINDLDSTLALQGFKSDKKHHSDSYAIILPNAEGFLESTLISATPKIDLAILEVFEWLKSGLNKGLAYEIQ
jgi:3-dehydroquinate synthase